MVQGWVSVDLNYELSALGGDGSGPSCLLVIKTKTKGMGVGWRKTGSVDYLLIFKSLSPATVVYKWAKWDLHMLQPPLCWKAFRQKSGGVFVCLFFPPSTFKAPAFTNLQGQKAEGWFPVSTEVPEARKVGGCFLQPALEMFRISFAMVVSRVQTSVKTHHLFCFKWMQFILCKIYLSKVVTFQTPHLSALGLKT